MKLMIALAGNATYYPDVMVVGDRSDNDRAFRYLRGCGVYENGTIFSRFRTTGSNKKA
jgi:hypothetical protein